MSLGVDRRSFIGFGGGAILAGAAACATGGKNRITKSGEWEPPGNFFEPAASPGKMEAPPPRICENGKIRLGQFNLPVKELNLSRARIMDGSLSFFPEFIGYGLTHPDWYLGAIIMDAKLLPRGGAVYLFGRKNRRITDLAAIAGGRSASIAASNPHGMEKHSLGDPAS